jgi:hypothetical protein
MCRRARSRTTSSPAKSSDSQGDPRGEDLRTADRVRRADRRGSHSQGPRARDPCRVLHLGDAAAGGVSRQSVPGRSGSCLRRRLARGR